MARQRLLIQALVLCFLGASLQLPAAAQEGIRWQQDIEGAKAAAGQSNRLVLVHFWTPECGPCRMLEQNVFNQPGVAGALETHFVPVKLNANENSAIAQKLGITRVPTDVILTPDGQMIGKLISPPTPSAYVAEVNQVATQYAGRSGAAFDRAVAGAPLPSQINSAYANLPIPATAAPATPIAQSVPVPDRLASAAPAAAGRSGALFPTVDAPTSQVPPAITPPATVTSNPAASNTAPPSVPTGGYAAITGNQTDRYYSSLSKATQAAQMPATTYNPLAAPQSTPTAPALVAASPVPPSSAPAARVPTAASITENRYASLPTSAAATQPVEPFNNPYPASGPPAATVAPLATSQTAAPMADTAAPSVGPILPTQPAAVASTTNAKPAPPDARRLPPNAPPLGFDGYCPVSMRTAWKWVPGNPQYGVIHRGRTYWFVGQQEQQEFLKNPDHFSPALSGLDPVLAIDHQQQVPGRRDHSLDYDNLFYLFASEATLQQFTANPERYATGARQAMGLQRGRLVR